MVRLSHMRQTNLERLKRIVRSETGQMSIFIALIFQVLFVFFAMVINIGLIVHDKINLQNAVDLGAYYAAQRQAEVLNEIAHINYQIRQDYKLLAWRYRVLGTLGRTSTGVPQKTLSGSIPEAPIGELPSFCVANDSWREVLATSVQNENYCYQQYNRPIQYSPILNVVAPFIPGIGAARSASIDARNNQIASCLASGPFNWYFLMQMVYAYKMSIAGRKAMIENLRRNLVSPQMVDQNLESVRDGVLATIRNNLTASNRGAFSDGDFEVYNGLSNPTCAGPDGDGSPTLPETKTRPLFFYTNAVSTGSECIFNAEYQTSTPNFQPGSQLNDPVLRALVSEPGTAGADAMLHSTLGYEKNPWCMAYFGVKAKTRPRKPFAPFGQAVTLEARSFAQPFGGRIGPWYGTSWSPGSPQSNPSPRTDPLTSSRMIANVSDGSSPDLPNFSRFPGDRLGLESRAAMAATRKLLNTYTQALPQLRLSINFYTKFDNIQQTGDPLAWDGDVNTPPNNVPPSVANLRRAEMIAVAPDVFDATYYSIEPQYAGNYLGLPNETQRFPNLPSIFAKRYAPMPDIGGRNDVAILKGISVASQVLAANGGDSQVGLDPELLEGSLRYPIRKWEHLLTSWTAPGVSTFVFPDGIFGNCANKAKATFMVPGGCAQGGRTGYSVRTVSRDHLLSPTWNVGGAGSAPAEILNKPPAEF
jgi:Flp pilus assembly protein TadG